MREIKFRAWAGGVMVYFGLEDIVRQHNESFVVRSGYTVGPNSPKMQFTGLYDKRGVGIYDSDILQRVRENGIATWRLGWLQRHGCWDAVLLTNPSNDTRVTFYPFEWNIGEVIGNIYENPELAKGEENEWENLEIHN